MVAVVQAAPTRTNRERGEYKLAVYFFEHRSKDGRAYYFWSKRRQDLRDISVAVFKRLVTGRWKDKVSWAGIYHQSILQHEFKSNTGEWEAK